MKKGEYSTSILDYDENELGIELDSNIRLMFRPTSYSQTRLKDGESRRFEVYLVDEKNKPIEAKQKLIIHVWGTSNISVNGVIVIEKGNKYGSASMTAGEVDSLTPFTLSITNVYVEYKNQTNHVPFDALDKYQNEVYDDEGGGGEEDPKPDIPDEADAFPPLAPYPSFHLGSSSICWAS